MEKKIRHMETVAEYNAILGAETLHPMVSVIDMAKAPCRRYEFMTFGFYCVYLKDVKCGDLIYGRQRYDYQAGTVVCGAGAGARTRGQRPDL